MSVATMATDSFEVHCKTGTAAVASCSPAAGVTKASTTANIAVLRRSSGRAQTISSECYGGTYISYTCIHIYQLH